MPLTSSQYDKCDELAEVFVMSAKEGYDSEKFLNAFMNSSTAERIDNRYDQANYACSAFIFEDFARKNPGFPKGDVWHEDDLHWIGYTYRYWHFLTGEKSPEICRQAPPDIMRRVYPGFHCMDCEVAIERLKEMHLERQAKEMRRHAPAQS